MGLKSLAKKGAATAKKLSKASLKEYRQYVWYDYSIVEKAKIQIIESNGPIIGSCIPGSQNELEFVEELPVQISPSSFRYEHSMDTNDIRKELISSRQSLAPGFVLHSFGDHETSSFDPELLFDIYDEYNARTGNGSIPTDFSLANESDPVTSLQPLIKYAHENRYFARFIWGDMIKFGLLSGITVDYTAFSQWGQPLKATATLHIIEEPTLNGAKNLSIKGIPGFTKMETATNVGKKVINGYQNIFR